MNEKMRELLAKIENKKSAARAFLSENKKVEAKKLIEEIKDLKESYEIEAALYEDEKANMKMKVEPKKNENEKEAKRVAFNKAVLGKKLNSAEAALVEGVPESGGYLVPEEQHAQLVELRRDLISLKDYCNVIPVSTRSGALPVEVESTDTLTNFSEFTEITESDIKFGQVKWDVSDYGDIIPISNSLLQDENVNLTSFVGNRFTKKAIRTENKAILNILKGSKKVAGKDYNDLYAGILDLDVAIRANTKIYTNKEGYKYLATLKDKNNNTLITNGIANPGIKYFYDYEIVEVPAAEFPDTKGKLHYYVGSMADGVTFFDRNVYEMAVDSSAGFTKNAIYMRVIERFDVKQVDAGAFKLIELTIAE